MISLLHDPKFKSIACYHNHKEIFPVTILQVCFFSDGYECRHYFYNTF